MKHSKFILSALLAGAGLALGAASFAVASERKETSPLPRTDQARATLTGEHRTAVRQQVCQGEDGEYREALEVFQGTSVSDDPRLAGPFTVRIRSFINRSPDQQEGTVEGQIEIRNSAGGRVKALFFAVSDDAATLEGTFVGQIRSADGNRSERFYANFFGSFNAMDDDPDFRISLGQEPATDSPRNSAVIQRGGCSSGPGAPGDLSDPDTF